MFQETCEFCGGEGVVADDDCIFCEGTGVEILAHHPSAPPHAGCDHGVIIIEENGSRYCDSCGCPLDPKL